jgi:hypothetical protein
MELGNCGFSEVLRIFIRICTIICPDPHTTKLGSVSVALKMRIRDTAFLHKLDLVRKASVTRVDKTKLNLAVGRICDVLIKIRIWILGYVHWITDKDSESGSGSCSFLQWHF